MQINEVLFTKNSISNIGNIISQHLLKTEIGGSLVGYQLEEKLIVTHASDAGENVKMTYNSIEIDGGYTTNFCNRLNVLSNHRLYYIGDWHTHLSNNLNPSNSDLIAMKRLFRYIPIDYRDTLITVIIDHNNPNHFKAYCLQKEKKLVTVSHSIIPNPSFIEEFL